MKLHLGCGKKKLEGYINCDLKDSDHDCDIRELPFEDESADEIMAIHVVEHFSLPEVFDVMRDWTRVLKPGGKLIIELPCWDKVKLLISSDQPDNMTRWALYGEPRTHVDGYPALHKWCWSFDEIEILLKESGFKEVSRETPQYHVPVRDMRLEAIK